MIFIANQSSRRRPVKIFNIRSRRAIPQRRPNSILAGHRDPNYLASLAHFRVKKSPDEIAAALHGNWREDLLFELRSCRLVPNNKLSGGRIISSKTPKGKNAIALALRQAANSIGNQKEHPLTPFFKRIAYRKGRNAAITATARKLAIIIWNMITKTQDYLQPDNQLLFDRRKLAQVNNIKARLFRLNLSETEMTELFQKTSFPSP